MQNDTCQENIKLMSEHISEASIKGYLFSDEFVLNILSFEFQFIIEHVQAVLNTPIEDYLLGLNYFDHATNVIWKPMIKDPTQDRTKKSDETGFLCYPIDIPNAGVSVTVIGLTRKDMIQHVQAQKIRMS